MIKLKSRADDEHAHAHFRNKALHLLGVLSALLAALLIAHPASVATGDVQTAWQLIDYIAVDYAGAVKHGDIISRTEFAEMNEFSGAVTKKLVALPAKPGRPLLVADAEQLKSLIAGKAAPQDLAKVLTTNTALGLNVAH